MKIAIRYCGMNARAIWQGLVESQLKKLQPLAVIAVAQVALKRQYEAKPSFQVSALLEVPGPDFHAEASDYTLQGALLKVVKNLERQMRARRGRQADKWKTRIQLGLSPGRSSLTLAGSRA